MTRLPLVTAGCLVALGSLLACTSADPTAEDTTLNDASKPTSESVPPPSPWLVDVTTEWGLDFVHHPGPVDERPAPAIMGSGAAFFDCDGDGDLDAYLLQAGSDSTGPAAGRAVNRLYRQTEGRFEDATEDSGLGDTGFGMGVAVGDIDNDGDEDVYVSNLGRDRLYRNVGACRFEEVAARAGIAVDGWSSSAVFCDLNRDGFLDLYVARDVVLESGKECRDSTGRLEFCGPESFADAFDVLFLNQGDGSFRDATAASGVSARTGSGLGVVCQDLTGDGWADVYVANDADPNQLWVNGGDGTLADEAVMLGAGVNAQGFPEAGMGVVAADLDGDLDLDLFMTHLEDESNTLYRNLGPGSGYEDATFAAGLATASMPLTGFGTLAVDLDQDGFLDLLVVNGKVKRGRAFANDLELPWRDYAEPNALFRGIGGGRFVAAVTEGGDFARAVEVSRGLAAGDLDGDGDLDLLVSNTAGRARLYRNDAPNASSRESHWLWVEPLDPALGRLAVGAEVLVTVGGRTWIGVATAGGSYLSSRDPRVHFGLGSATAVDGIEVRWPDGRRERFAGGPVDRVRRVERGAGEPLP